MLETIGNTPLVKLNSIGKDLPCTLLAKVEFFNPGGSVKDRIAVSMIDYAEKEGLLKPGGTIIEGTSGNTGAGLALVGIARGYKCIFTTTDKQSQEKVDVLRALGAEVIVCPTNVAPEDPRSYYSVSARLAKEIPGGYYVNQYDHPANAPAHYQTTGPELWEQTEGKITHYFAGAGTGGTISGTSKFLKEQNPDIKSIGVDPFGSVYYKYYHTGEFDEKEIYPYITEGVGEDILAGNMDFKILDGYVRVTDKASMQMTRVLSSEEGMFTGGSCGMVVAGALDWLEEHRDELTKDDVVVILLPDTGFRYLSKIFNDSWMAERGFMPTKSDITANDVLAMQKRGGNVISFDADTTLTDAIAQMTKMSISQVPVMDNGAMVGSLSETGILNCLLVNPSAGGQSVSEVMDKPFPIVDDSTNMESLSSLLDQGAGAVLVKNGDDANFHIVTKSDLITLLASSN